MAEVRDQMTDDGGGWQGSKGSEDGSGKGLKAEGGMWKAEKRKTWGTKGMAHRVKGLVCS